MPYSGPGPNRRPPKVARTLPVQGKGEDQGRFFRCWNCGFVCDDERESEAGPTENSNIYFIEVTNPNSLGASMGPGVKNVTLTLESPWFNNQVIMEMAADGTAKPIRYDRVRKSGSGCPLCGTTNWKGKLP